MLDLILVDIKKELCNEWLSVFKNYNEVKIICGRFEDITEYDCVVSAANSFGLMDGGVDLAITNYFGKQLQKRVQEYIIDSFSGEQPVGTSFIIETGNSLHPFLAHTPTMRVPSSIEGTDNVYYAMKAMLDVVSDFNKKANRIKTIVCPGLGTATGKVPYSIAARQMQLAYKNFISPPTNIDWTHAIKTNNMISSINKTYE